MKGFYIYETESRIGTEVDCLKIGDINHTFTHQISPATLSEEVKLHALVTKGTKSKCNKDDTYDFETGALISLMKMCGVDKVVRAFNEVFPKETYNTYITKYESELHERLEENKNLKEKSAELLGENSRLNYIKSCNESTIESLEKTRGLLKAENEKLKSDKDKSWKNYQRKIQKKQDRINELERAYKASNDDEAKLVEYYQREIKKLEAENEKLKDELRLKEDAINEWKQTLRERNEKIGDLVCENYKLKTDCEKLQHGYVYTDMMICGGRQNRKQFTFLVDLFKKIDQKKVDAAYKEAYNKWIAQPIWQKEVFKQIHKDQLASLLEAGKYLYKNLTKREKMWDDILKEGRTPVYVKREDIHEFLKECQATGIKWTTGKMPLETMPFHMSKGYDGIYFFVMTSLDISKSTSGSKEYRHVMCWWMTASDEEARNSIKYLPPMRWDLFKKGRLAVKVNYDNYKEFYEACEKEFGRRPVTAFFTEDFIVSICKKDGLFEIFTIEDQKKTGRKIVDWEDVR